MSKIVYHIVKHDGGWAYKVDETFSEILSDPRAGPAGSGACGT